MAADVALTLGTAANAAETIKIGILHSLSGTMAISETSHKDTLLMLIEIGGDDLSATFNPDLADLTIYVIDVSGGEKIPRKGRPRHHPLRPAGDQQDRPCTHVGASLEVMNADTKRMRGDLPYQFTSLRHGEGIDAIVEFIAHHGLPDTAA